MFDNSSIKEVAVIMPARKDSPKFPAVDGVELVAIRREVTDKYKATVFKFQDPQGNILEYKEFDPNRGPKQTDEEYKKSIDMAHSRVAHITRAYLTEAEFKNIKGNTWEEYLRATVAALQVHPSTSATPGRVGRASGVKGELKVVLRESKGKYYSTLPAVPPFLSTPNHPKTLTFNPAYDVMEAIAVKPDTEAGKTPSAPMTGFDSAPAANVQSPPPAEPTMEEAKAATSEW